MCLCLYARVCACVHGHVCHEHLDGQYFGIYSSTCGCEHLFLHLRKERKRRSDSGKLQMTWFLLTRLKLFLSVTESMCSQPLLHTLSQKDLTDPLHHTMKLYQSIGSWLLNTVSRYTQWDIDPSTKRRTNKRLNDELIKKNKWHKATPHRVREETVSICDHNYYTLCTRLVVSLRR